MVQPATPVVVVALDEERAVAEPIGPTGGSLSVTTANGSRLTLTIPEGALARTTLVTLTPFGPVNDLPENSDMIAGVEIGPDDLLLGKAAELAIVPGEAPRNLALPVYLEPASIGPAASNGSSGATALAILPATAVEGDQIFPGIYDVRCPTETEPLRWVVSVGLFGGGRIGLLDTVRSVIDQAFGSGPTLLCSLLVQSYNLVRYSQGQYEGFLAGGCSLTDEFDPQLVVALADVFDVFVRSTLRDAQINDTRFVEACKVLVCWMALVDQQGFTGNEPLPTLRSEGRFRLGVAAQTAVEKAQLRCQNGDPLGRSNLAVVLQALGIGLLDPTTNLTQSTLEDLLRQCASCGLPQVTSVVPSGDRPGSAVAFNVQFQGDATQATWDFGNGATPSAVRGFTPIVVLGAAGDYRGSVMLTNRCGDVTVSEFTFSVCALPRVLSISVPPLVAPGRPVAISVTASGTPTFIEWSIPGDPAGNLVLATGPTAVLTFNRSTTLSVRLVNGCGEARSSVFVRVATNYDFVYEGDISLSIPGSQSCGNVSRRAVLSFVPFPGGSFTNAAFGRLNIEWVGAVSCSPLTQATSTTAAAGNLLADSFSPFFLNAQDVVEGTFTGGQLRLRASSLLTGSTIEFVSSCRRLETEPPCR